MRHKNEKPGSGVFFTSIYYVKSGVEDDEIYQTSHIALNLFLFNTVVINFVLNGKFVPVNVKLPMKCILSCPWL